MHSTQEDAEPELDRGIAVNPVGDGEYAAELDGGWSVGGGLNGGYLLALVANAVRTALSGSGEVEPVSVSCYYLSPARPGSARVRIRPVRVGGQRATVAATLVQDEDGAATERLTVLAMHGPLEDGAVERQDAVPALPPREHCVPTTMAPEEVRRVAPLMERFDLRLDPAYAGWATGQPSGNGVIQGWLSLADGRSWDPTGLLLAVDALPPATFDLGKPGWAPTVELTVHVRAHPAPGPLVVRHETRNVSGGYFEEDCGVWDSTGRLVAQSRQLALLPRSTA